MSEQRPYICRLLLAALLITCEATALSFSGPEVLKLDWSTRSLNVSDIDNDGLNDMVLINNDTAKIELLYQLAEGSGEIGQKRQLNKNRWDPALEDAHFEGESITIGFPLFDLAVGDLDGDGRVDLAYTGRESPLTVRFQDESGNWADVEEFDEFEPLGWTDTLEIVDLNADGEAELVVISANSLQVIAVGDDKRLYQKGDYYITGQNPFNLKIEDVTGDGRADIVYISSDGKQSLVVREQLKNGRFGPELRFPFDRPVRVLHILPRNGEKAATFCSVDSRNGSLEFFSLQRKQAVKERESLLTKQPKIYPIFEKGRLEASYAIGDIDGDGLEDVLVANPDKAEVVLFLKKPGYFQSPQTFPSFSKISSMAYGHFFEGDQKNVAITSAGERTMGITRMNSEGRIEFPRQLVIGEGDPLVCQAVNLDGDGYDELALVLEKDDTKMLVLASPADRKNPDSVWIELARAELADVKRKPTTIREVAIFEENRSGLMVFVPREAPLFFSMDEMALSEVARSSNVRESLLKNVQPSQINVIDINADGENELVVGQAGYARALRLNGEKLEMMDQFNARRSEDKISAIIPFYKEDHLQELIFYIEESGAFQQIKRNQDGVFRYDSSVDVGRIELTDWYQLSNPQTNTAFIFTGVDRFWSLMDGADVWKRVVEKNYETDLEDVYYNFIDSADFDGNGSFELVAVDGQNHVVEILSEQNEGLESTLFWEIFEQNLHYQGRNGSKTEPRQIVIADLNNDGKLDFAFLVHDRILFYPQQ